MYTPLTPEEDKNFYDAVLRELKTELSDAGKTAMKAVTADHQALLVRILHQRFFSNVQTADPAELAKYLLETIEATFDPQVVTAEEAKLLQEKIEKSFALAGGEDLPAIIEHIHYYENMHNRLMGQQERVRAAQKQNAVTEEIKAQIILERFEWNTLLQHVETVLRALKKAQKNMRMENKTIRSGKKLQIA